jgi:hypothetical protein
MSHYPVVELQKSVFASPLFGPVFDYQVQQLCQRFDPTRSEVQYMQGANAYHLQVLAATGLRTATVRVCHHSDALAELVSGIRLLKARPKRG